MSEQAKVVEFEIEGMSETPETPECPDENVERELRWSREYQAAGSKGCIMAIRKLLGYAE